MQLHTFLTFTGNCRQAMEFYQTVLGGELRMQALRDSPHAAQFSPTDQHLIVQATLTTANWKLMGTDLSDSIGQAHFVSVALQCDSAADLQSQFQRLAKAGSIRYLPQQNTEGRWNAECTDRYGNRWLLYVL
jgi:PhnB protein